MTDENAGTNWDDPVIERLRERTHALTNAIVGMEGRLLSQLVKMETKLDVIAETTKDHEARIRQIEVDCVTHAKSSGHPESQLDIDNLARQFRESLNDTEGRFRALEATIGKLQTRMAVWGGMGALTGGLAVTALPYIAKALGG